MKSLITNSNTQQSDIIMICETKGNPPKMDGYKWHTKNRTSQKGGGVAIAVKTELHKYSSKLDDLEDNNQEVLWVELKIPKNDIIHLGVYYGKQENEPKEEIEREYSQLRTQIIRLKRKGKIILAEDFNAKLEINKTGP